MTRSPLNRLENPFLKIKTMEKERIPCLRSLPEVKAVKIL